MITLERSSLILIVYLTIFFNIERVDLDQPNLIDISSLLYVLVLLALIVILSVPRMSRVNLPLLILLWSIFYLGTRMLALPYYHRALWGGIYTYLTITEISLSSIAIILAYQVRRQLTDFRQAVENLTLSGLANRIQHKEDAYDDIQKEFLRSRRHHFNLITMIVQPDPATVKISLNRSILEIQKKMMTRYAVTNIMRMASNFIRRTDLIVDHVVDKDSFVVLLTDTNMESALHVAERFQDMVNKTMGIKINFGLASFPDDGLTFDDLIAKADAKIQNHAIDFVDAEELLNNKKQNSQDKQ